MPTTRLRIADLLWHNVHQQPGQVAVRIDGVAVTWHELGRRVEDAIALLGNRVQPGDRVGLWFHNSFAWVASFLALNDLGAVSVPINTRLTGTELKVIFEVAELHALVTTSSYRGRNYLDEACSVLADAGRHLLVIQADDFTPATAWPVRELGNASTRSLNATPVGVFCIQFTSGTTSIPKGVMLTDAAYLQTANYVARCQRLTPASRFISAGPFFHCSGSMHAITVCLLAGCTLHSMSVWDPQRFVDDVARYQCDVSHMVYYRDVLALGAERVRPQLASMQTTHDLGTPDYLMRIVNELGIPGVSNIYGMTETAGQFTMWFPDDPLAQRVQGNGRPQAGNFVRIADPHSMEVVPQGETGEIQMRGPTISPGYFGNARARAEAFTDDGWFRSGDLGRIAELRQLVYVARLKEMIRVGGENLAPAEVEQVLRDLCQTPSACVLGMPDARLDEVAVAVLVKPQTTDWSLLVTQLRQRLAGFKVPRAIYVTDQMPMTATNRVQRATLRKAIESGQLDRVA
jgi:fatty-acyl-CoA synthase